MLILLLKLPKNRERSILFMNEACNIMIRMEQVRKSFGKLQVLNNINLEVAESEVVCLIGPSGSGKSTLLRCLNHLERITS